MFSSRTNWNLTPNALHQLLEEKRRRGQQIVDLTESNPTRCGFLYRPELLGALTTERSLLYEPEPRGLLTARNAIADHYAQHGFRADPANIFLTAGTSEAYAHLFKLLCNPGDNILVPKPSYPLFDYLCALNDVEARQYRLRYDDEWHIDLDSIRHGVDQSTKALLLVHPNNPTGSFVKETECAAIVKMAEERGLALIVDEVFGEFSLGDTGDLYKSFATGKGFLVFTLNGISKLLGLPQMKLAWITVTGQPGQVQEASNRLEIISDTFLSVGTPIQQALPSLLEKGQRVTEQIKKRVNANYRTLGFASAQSSVSPLKVEGGWYAIVRLPGILTDEAWALRLLRESNVLVHPGHFFEIEQDACIVLSLLPEESAFSTGFGKTLELVHSNLAT